GLCASQVLTQGEKIMMDRAPRRLLALLQLVFGILAWSAVTSLHAQAPQPPDNPPPPAPVAPAPQPAPSGGQALSPSQAAAPDQPALMERIRGHRFQFKIDPQTPLKDLLPAPPKIKKITGPVLGNDLTRVPEIQFQASPTADAEATKRIAHQMAKIN